MSERARQGRDFPSLAQGSQRDAHRDDNIASNAPRYRPAFGGDRGDEHLRRNARYGGHEASLDLSRVRFSWHCSCALVLIDV